MIPRRQCLPLVGWIAAWALGISACAVEAPDSDPATDGAELSRQVPGQGAHASFETEDTLPSGLKTIAVEAVQDRTGPGGEVFYVALRTPEGAATHLSRQIGQQTFRLGLRLSSPDLTQYPCSSCHDGREIIDDGTERVAEGVHNNIRPLHPEETGAQCLTCHAAENVGTLALGTGGAVGLDHSYRLCAQCHFPEVDSWANGAHGKRLVGWRGRRVVMGCTDCHNPHRPGTEQRIPYPGPELPTRLIGEGHD